MNLGLGLSLGARGAGFSPAALFSAGEQGAWFDPSDFNTMFQDSQGTTPVTAVGQPVGLWLDKSQGLVLGPELVTNGDFSSGTGWTLSGGATVSGGVLNANEVTTLNFATQNSSLVVGEAYFVSFTMTRISGAVSVFAGGVSAANQVGSTSYTTSGTKTGLVICNASGFTNQIVFRAEGGFIGSIDNISVRELAGNHGTQPTAASRPVLGRVPVGGRRNLLTFTEQFDDAAWVLQAAGTGVSPTRTLGAGASPAGVTACRLQFSLGGGTTATDQSIFRQSTTVPSGAGVFSVLLRSTDGVSSYVMQLTDPSGSGQNITVTGSWQRFQVTGASAGTAVNYQLRLRGGQSPANSNTADVLFSEPQVETGSTATNYQRVVTALDVTQAGVPDCYYLSFDGTDDFLLTPTITPGTDKAQVFAGVRKLGTSTAILAELSANAGTNLGSFYVAAPDTPAEYSAASHGSMGIAVNQISSVTGVGQSPDTAVISTLADIAADSTIIRRNGLAFPAGTGDQGTGNYLAYPLYIGRRGGTSLPFNGQIFSLIVRFGANLPAATITQAEAFVNSKTGAY